MTTIASYSEYSGTTISLKTVIIQMDIVSIIVAMLDIVTRGTTGWTDFQSESIGADKGDI